MAIEVPRRAVLSRPLSVPLIATVVGALPLAVAAQQGSGLRDATFWLQLVVAGYAGVRLCAMVLSGRRRLVQGAFWLFGYLAMGIAPLAQSVLGRDPTPVLGPREDTQLATALVLCGMIAFDVGALLARVRPLGRERRRPASVHRGRLWLLVLLGYAASGLLIVQLGGPAVFFTSRQELGLSLAEATGTPVDGEGGEAGSALLRGFGTVPALLALLFLTRWLVTSGEARRRPAVVLAWAGLLLLNAVVNNPISNPRYWFLTVLFALLFTVFPRSPVMYRAALALGLVVALLIFPFTDRFRYAEEERRPLETDSVLEPLVIKDYDQLNMFANTVTFAGDGHGHSYGEQLLGAALFFVPRGMWADKPEDTGFLVGGWMGTDSANLSSPLWAELWLDFGLLGMSLGFAGIGYLAARTDRRYVRRTLDDPSPGNVLAVVVPVLAGYGFILLRGSLLQASGRIGIALLCLALVTTFRPRPHTELR
ncbi:hypothetical protein RM844_00675 [Streptomyces sp. DSM 44915]|uniref:Oligosaccharide repeat unit polymerase n=1 Tax=Streptomyces chisholmiae TaxID=3075540 RepID=A0ABU2JIH8_9ACTN|nr:hypothetical protein [Streptomyces sp. DSM 44915]MDT0264796.1 hypothetical protein [Streptomyces sp. DSM 44915]